MAFPEEADRKAIRKAESLVEQATDLTDWLAEFAAARRDADVAISDRDELEALSLRRTAVSLYNSARVPAAAAVYGPSQVGKSLFLGSVLEPLADDASPLGRDEQHGEPAYYRSLSFTNDLNPQSGSNEATALVTRFTTKDRMQANIPSRFPVLVRSLSRSQWMRVLARGFMVECEQGETVFDEAKLEATIANCEPSTKATPRDWRNDLVDTFQYAKHCAPLRYPASEAFFSGLLSRYPLSTDGCAQLAGALFWNRWRSLSSLFVRVCEFLDRVGATGSDGILTHWAGVRFLLDSQRAMSHHNPNSKCFSEVRWQDLRLVQSGDWQALEYESGRGDGHEDLATIQAAMLEMVIPILPHRISEEWRQVLEQFDLLDIPGMRAGREGAAGGLRDSADSLEEQLEIVKRGKVQFLFDRYIEERQIQTLLLLTRGGNLEVRGQMKGYIDRWGKVRYGDSWPERVTSDPPALFLGMTGIDEEFRNRGSLAGPELYDNRLRQLADTLQSAMEHFGGRDRPFQNVFPIRYPGTWDADSAQQVSEGSEKWQVAGEAFTASKLVGKHVADAASRWRVAMQDGDGGLSLISRGFRATTDNASKRIGLEQLTDQIQQRVRALSNSWSVPPEANLARDRRRELGESCLNWLIRKPEKVISRFAALRESLCLESGDALAIADFSELRWDDRLLSGGSTPERLGKLLQICLDEWCETLAPSRWRIHVELTSDQADEFSLEQFQNLVVYLRDFLMQNEVLSRLVNQLADIVTIKLRDESAARQARRNYTTMVLNDYIHFLGPSDLQLEPPQSMDFDGRAFGPLQPIIQHWHRRLPSCLALGAGDAIVIPPGNEELHELIQEWA